MWILLMQADAQAAVAAVILLVALPVKIMQAGFRVGQAEAARLMILLHEAEAREGGKIF